MTAEPIHLTNATPFDLIAEDAETWLDEARNWADGQPVENQKQADAVSMIIDALRKSADAAEKQRKVEVKPLDDAKAAVQERYAPLFAPATNKSPGKVHKAVAALKAVLAPYLRKLEEEKRAAEARAREEAERAAREAAEALRAANAADLAAREAAEEKVRQAEAADRAAKQAANDRAHANGGERAIGLRTRHVGMILDLNEAVKFYWRQDDKPFCELIQRLVDADIRAGRRGSAIPGVEIREEKVL